MYSFGMETPAVLKSHCTNVKQNGFKIECDAFYNWQSKKQRVYYQIDCRTSHVEEFKAFCEERLKQLNIEFEYTTALKVERALQHRHKKE